MQKKLIGIIEEHGLWVFDLAVTPVNTPILNTPQMPQEKEGIELMSQVIIDNDLSSEEVDLIPQVSIGNNLSKAEEKKNRTDLALPFYFYETKANQTGAANNGQLVHAPFPKRERKIKIRPILPHPYIQLNKRE